LPKATWGDAPFIKGATLTGLRNRDCRVTQDCRSVNPGLYVNNRFAVTENHVRQVKVGAIVQKAKAAVLPLTAAFLRNCLSYAGGSIQPHPNCSHCSSDLEQVNHQRSIGNVLTWNSLRHLCDLGVSAVNELGAIFTAETQRTRGPRRENAKRTLPDRSNLRSGILRRKYPKINRDLRQEEADHAVPVILVTTRGEKIRNCVPRMTKP
jgi:hypothetical protein